MKAFSEEQIQLAEWCILHIEDVHQHALVQAVADREGEVLGDGVAVLIHQIADLLMNGGIQLGGDVVVVEDHRAVRELLGDEGQHQRDAGGTQ